MKNDLTKLQISDYLYNTNLIDKNLYLVTQIIKYSFYKIKNPKMNSSFNIDIKIFGGPSIDNMPNLCDNNRNWYFLVDILKNNNIINNERTLEVFGLEISYKQLRKELSTPTPHTIKNRALIRKQNELKIKEYISNMINILQFLSDNIIFSKKLINKAIQ